MLHKCQVLPSLLSVCFPYNEDTELKGKDSARHWQTFFAMKWVPCRRFQHYSMWIGKLKQLSSPNHSTCEEKPWDSNSSKLFRICVLWTTVPRAVWHLQGIALVAWCCTSLKVCQLQETAQDETLEEEWAMKMLAVGNDGTLQGLRSKGQRVLKKKQVAFIWWQYPTLKMYPVH